MESMCNTSINTTMYALRQAQLEKQRQLPRHNDVYKKAFNVTTDLVAEEMAKMEKELEEGEKNQEEMYMHSKNNMALTFPPQQVPSMDGAFPQQQVASMDGVTAAAIHVAGADDGQHKSNISTMQKFTNLSLSQRQKTSENTNGPNSIKENFPMTLHRLLSDLDSLEQNSDIAVYEPDGKTFHILDSKTFEREVMALYFPRLKTFSAFRLQLKIYRFEELTSPLLQSEFAYSHPQFHRDSAVSVAFMQPGNAMEANNSSIPRGRSSSSSSVRVQQQKRQHKFNSNRMNSW